MAGRFRAALDASKQKREEEALAAEKKAQAKKAEEEALAKEATSWLRSAAKLLEEAKNEIAGDIDLRIDLSGIDAQDPRITFSLHPTKLAKNSSFSAATQAIFVDFNSGAMRLTKSNRGRAIEIGHIKAKSTDLLADHIESEVKALGKRTV